MPEQVTQHISRSAQVPAHHSGQRLDQAAAELFTGFSRSQLQQWIRDGKLTVNGQAVAKPNHRLAGSEQLELNAEQHAHGDDQPEDIPLDIIHSDADLLVVSKPPGLVVHPGAGNRAGTLVNALLNYDEQLALQPRAGIVHRLDKDTSGALLVARRDDVRQQLSAMLKAREIHRHYLALVWGQPDSGGSIDLPLGRHPVERVRMAVRPTDDRHARDAVTHYQIRQRYPGVTLLDVKLETGRTHQIRVHLTHQGFPLVGDPLYTRKGVQRQLAVSEAAEKSLSDFSRQCLHAARLRLRHPVSGVTVDARAPLPDDFAALLEQLDNERA